MHFSNILKIINIPWDEEGKPLKKKLKALKIKGLLNDVQIPDSHYKFSFLLHFIN